MVDRVFRITFWTRLQNSKWRQKKKSLYDSEIEYKRGAKSYRRMVDRRQDGKVLGKALFEEFLGGNWVELEAYPAETEMH